MKKIFEIEWPDDLGEEWLNVGNLKTCLCSEICILSSIPINVTEIKNDQRP